MPWETVQTRLPTSPWRKTRAHFDALRHFPRSLGFRTLLRRRPLRPSISTFATPSLVRPICVAAACDRSSCRPLHIRPEHLFCMLTTETLRASGKGKGQRGAPAANARIPSSTTPKRTTREERSTWFPMPSTSRISTKALAPSPRRPMAFRHVPHGDAAMLTHAPWPVHDAHARSAP